MEPEARAHLPVRLRPGDDLRAALQEVARAAAFDAAFVIAGIGSLRPCALRLAGAAQVTVIDDDVELLTLCGTVAGNGVHLHASVSLPDGRVLGGHVAAGCRIRTTAEVLLLPLPGFSFTREHDPATGYPELRVAESPKPLRAR